MMNVPARKTLSRSVLVASFGLAVAGCYHGIICAQEPNAAGNRYDPRLPYSDARVGIQRHSPYLYRYENDWQRNKAWRERDNPLLNLPKIDAPGDPKARSGDDSDNSGASDP